MAIVGTDNEEVASERWKRLIPKVYRLAKKRQKVGRVSLLYLKLSSVRYRIVQMRKVILKRLIYMLQIIFAT